MASFPDGATAALPTRPPPGCRGSGRSRVLEAAAGSGKAQDTTTSSAAASKSMPDYVLGLRGGVVGGGLAVAAGHIRQERHDLVEPVVHGLQVTAHRAHVRREGGQNARLARLSCGEEEQQ